MTQRNGTVQGNKWVAVCLHGRNATADEAVLSLRANGHVPIYYFPRQDLLPAQRSRPDAERDEMCWPKSPAVWSVFDFS